MKWIVGGHLNTIFFRMVMKDHAQLGISTMEHKYSSSMVSEA